MECVVWWEVEVVEEGQGDCGDDDTKAKSEPMQVLQKHFVHLNQ
jgi:hypothetical protein